MKKLLVMLLCVLLAVLPMTNALAFSMPAALTTIESEAFEGDKSIGGTISLPSKVQSIGYEAFKDTNVFGMWIPSSIREIGSNILAGTDAMYAVVPASGIDMADDAFSGVKYVLTLRDSTVHGQVTANGSECIFTDDIVWHNNFCYGYNYDVGGYILLFPRSTGISGSVTVPQSVNGKFVYDVSPHAFTRLSGVTEINVPDTATLPSDPENWPNAPINVYGTAAEPEIPDIGYEVQLDTTRLTMNPGDEYWLWVADELPELREVFFTSSNEDVVAVNEHGGIEAIGTGKAAVTGTFDCGTEGVFYGVCQIEVVEPAVEITLYNDQMELAVGKMDAASYGLTVSGLEENVEISLESSDPETVYCESPYYFKGLKPGTATVTYTATLYGVSDTATVEVTVVEPDVALNHMSLYGYSTFDYQLEVTGELPEGATVEWTSEDENIATVDENGLVSIHAEGDTYIICTVKYADGSEYVIDCDLHSLDWHMAWENIEEPYVMNVGDHYRCRPTLEQYFWSWEIDESVRTFTISDESIVRFDENDDAIALAPGLVRVHAHAEFRGREAEDDFYILVNGEEEFTVIMDQSSVNMNVGDITSIWPTEEFGADIFWSSSNEDVVSVYGGELIAKGLGSATVTARMVDGDGTNYYAYCFVQVVEPDIELNLYEDHVRIPVGKMYYVDYDCNIGGLVENASMEVVSSDPETVYAEDVYWFKGLKPGTATVTYTAYLGDASDSKTVKVEVYEPEIALNTPTVYGYTTFDYQLEVTSELPEGATVEWYSEDENIAVVDENGLVSAVGEGDTYIICTVKYADGSEASVDCDLHTLDWHMQWEHIDDPFEMYVGNNFRCRPTLEQYFWSWEIDESIRTFEISDESIVRFDENDDAIALAPGLVRVRAHAEFRGRETTYDYFIRVHGDDASAVPMDPTYFALNVGDLAWCWPAEDLGNSNEWIWTSSNEDVVTVDGGEITAKGLGEALITVKMVGEDDTLYAYCFVDVVEPYIEVITYQDEMYLLPNAIWYPGFDLNVGGLMDNVEIAFESSDESVITCNGTASVLSHNPGEAILTITAKFGDLTDSKQIAVYVEDPELKLNHVDFRTYPGFEHQLEILDEIPDDATVAWYSSDREVAEVDENGLVTVYSEGWTRIFCTVTYKDGTRLNAFCDVEALDWYMEWVDVDTRWMWLDHENPQADHPWPMLEMNAWPGDYDEAMANTTITLSDPSVISVDENRGATPLKEGIVRVHLRTDFRGRIAECDYEIIVESDEKFAITMNPSYLKMNPGDTAWAMPDYEPGDWNGFTWTSSDEDVATFDEYKITAKNLGSATLTQIMPEEKTYYSYMIVDVVEPAVGLELYETEIAIPVGREVNVPLDYWYDGLDENFDLSIMPENLDIVGEDLKAAAPGETNVVYTASLHDVSVSKSVKVTVYEPELVLNDLDLYTFVGLEEQLELLTEIPEDATVEWYSDNEEICTVDENGLLYIHNEGEAVVYCAVTYADGTRKEADCIVYAFEAMLEWAENGFTTEMVVGDVERTHPGLWHSTTPDHPDGPEIELISSDPSIVTFNEDEETVALAEGEAEITAIGRAYGREVVCTYTVVVKAPEMYIEFYEDEIELYNINEVSRLEFDWHCQNGADRIRFTSDNESVVTVDGSGWLTPVNSGVATVTATVISGNYSVSDTVTVRVSNRHASAAILPGDTTLNVGESIQLALDVELAEGEHMDGFWFNTHDESIAHVTSEGLLTGVSAGSTIVTVEGGIRTTETDENGEPVYVNFNQQIRVTVKDESAAITLNHSSVDLLVGNSIKLEAQLPEGATDVTWTSDDPNNTCVDENGVVFANKLHHGNQPATITCTATVNGEEVSASCKVYVYAGDMSIRDLYDMQHVSVGSEWEVGYEISAVGLVPYTIEWETEDKNIATVDENGVVTGVGPGITKLWMHLYAGNANTFVGSRFAYVFVDTEVPAADEFYFAYDSKLVGLTEGSNKTFSDLVMEPQWIGDNTSVSFYSDNTDVAVMDGWDIIGVGPGKATITAVNSNNPSQTATMTVYVADVNVDISTTELNVGDTLTISATNIPEDYPFEEMDGGFWCDYDGYYFSEVKWTDTSVTLRAIRATDGDYLPAVWGDLGLGQSCPGFSFSHKVTINGDPAENNYTIDRSDVPMNVGEYAEVYPTFDGIASVSWTSDNESVATVNPTNRNCCITATGLGECKLTGTYTLDDGSVKTLYVWVHVAEPAWTMHELQMSSVMEVDNWYGLDAWIDHTSWTWPEHEWTISDPTVAELNLDNNDLHTLKAGKFTITLTFFDGEYSESISKEITVVEPEFKFEDRYLSMRKGQSQTLAVESSKEIETLTWKSLDPSIATMDENVVTLISDEAPVMIVATATFTDGTTGHAICWIDAVRDEDIWAEVWVEGDTHFDLEKNETGYIYVAIDTNAAPEEINITWEAADDTIVSVSPLESTGLSHGAMITPLTTGGTYIYAHVQIGEDGCFHDQTFECYVNVYEKYFTVAPTETAITMNVGDNKYIEWNAQWERYAVGRIEDVVSDPSVITASVHDQIRALKPGTATITRTYYETTGELLGTASVNVTVQGPEIKLYLESDPNQTDDIMLGANETPITDRLIAEVNANGCTIQNSGWESSNPEIVAVTNDGVLVPLKFGITEITYWVNTDIGHFRTSVKVWTEGYAPDPTLQPPQCALYKGQSFQFELDPYYGTPTSTHWYVQEGYEHYISVDQTGLVTVNEVDHADVLAGVFCDAVINDESVTVYGYVNVKTPTMRIEGRMFNEDTCLNMRTGDVQDCWEAIWTNESADREVIVEYWSDNNDVASIYECEDNVVRVSANGPGETTVHMSISDGADETYTADLLVRVDMGDVAIESIAPRFETIVMQMGWDHMRDVEIINTPTYANRDYTFVSDNIDVVTVGERDGRLLGGNPGRATVYAVANENAEVTTSVDVLVLNDQITFGPADGRTSLKPGESVQLEFQNANWTDEDVDHIEYEYAPVTEDGVLTISPDWDDSGDVRARVWFKSDYFVDYTYKYTIDRETPYVFMEVGEGQFETALRGYPGLVKPVAVRWNCSENIQEFKYDSSNTDVATVESDEYGNPTVTCVANGEAVITCTLVLESGDELSCNMPVYVSDVQAPVIECCPDANILYVGDNANTYIRWENSAFSICPEHYYESSDPEILQVDGSAEENPNWTITALKPGKVTLTAVANYGDQVATHSVTVYVLEAPATPISDFTYTIENGEATITAYNGTETNVSVPAEIESNPVTAIGDYAFDGCTSLERIVLPEGITSIGSYAFNGCTSLKSITIAASVTNIGRNDFISANNITVRVHANSPAHIWCVGNNVRYEFVDGGIQLNAEKLTLGERETFQLSATLPEDQTSLLTYASSDDTIATVDENGLVRGVTPGYATITATTPDGLTGACAVTVMAAPTGVTLTPMEAIRALDEGGLQLTVSFGADGEGGGYRFESSDDTIATVSAEGFVTFLRTGIVEITVTTYNNYTATSVIDITEAPDGIAFTQEEIKIALGDTIYIPLEFTGGGGSYVLSVENDAIASASGSWVTGLEIGSTTLTATTYNNLTATVTLTVVAAPTEITLDCETLELDLGEEQLLTATTNAEDGVGSYTFSSSAPDIAAVDSQSGLVTALADGEATITVTTYNGFCTASCQVTVNGVPTYRALIAGEYAKSTDNGYLPFSANNVAGVKAALSQADIDGIPYSQLVSGTNRGKSNILGQIRTQFADAKPYDISVIYLCAHGLRQVTGSNEYVLTMTGYEDNKTSSYYITGTELMAAISTIPSKVILILDSCYSGGFLTKFGGTVSSNPNLAVLCAAGADTKGSYWNTTGSDSVDFYTYSLLEGIGYEEKSGTTQALHGDANGDGAVSLAEAAAYAKSATVYYVTTYSSYSKFAGTASQVPVYNVSGMEDVIFFAR